MLLCSFPDCCSLHLCSEIYAGPSPGRRPSASPQLSPLPFAPGEEAGPAPDSVHKFGESIQELRRDLQDIKEVLTRVSQASSRANSNATAAAAAMSAGSLGGVLPPRPPAAAARNPRQLFQDLEEASGTAAAAASSSSGGDGVIYHRDPSFTSLPGQQNRLLPRTALLCPIWGPTAAPSGVTAGASTSSASFGQMMPGMQHRRPQAEEEEEIGRLEVGRSSAAELLPWQRAQSLQAEDALRASASQLPQLGLPRTASPANSGSGAQFQQQRPYLDSRENSSGSVYRASYVSTLSDPSSPAAASSYQYLAALGREQLPPPPPPQSPAAASAPANNALAGATREEPLTPTRASGKQPPAPRLPCCQPLQSKRSCPSAAVATPQHPRSYMEVLEMLERGETPPGINDKIRDVPEDPDQAPSEPKLRPRQEGWRQGGH